MPFIATKVNYWIAILALNSNPGDCPQLPSLAKNFGDNINQCHADRPRIGGIEMHAVDRRGPRHGCGVEKRYAASLGYISIERSQLLRLRNAAPAGWLLIRKRRPAKMRWAHEEHARRGGSVAIWVGPGDLDTAVDTCGGPCSISANVRLQVIGTQHDNHQIQRIVAAK